MDLDFPFHVTSFRMYNVYGPRQALDNPYQGVLGIFLGNLLRREPITIFGDGGQSRDFVYIGDIIEAWVGALRSPASYGGVFNLGSGQRIPINQLAEMAIGALGREKSANAVMHAPGRPGEQRHVEADITRAKTVLSWEPKVSFDEGLAETVAWAQGAAPKS
jgi:UDP-glucose 4-epimerase